MPVIQTGSRTEVLRGGERGGGVEAGAPAPTPNPGPPRGPRQRRAPLSPAKRRAIFAHRPRNGVERFVWNQMRRDSESAFLTEALNRIGACISSQKAGSGDYRPVAEGDVLQTVLINRLEDRGQTRDRLMVGVFEQSGRNG